MPTSARAFQKWPRYVYSPWRAQMHRYAPKIITSVWILAAVLMGFGATAARAGCSDGPGPGVDWSKCQKQHKIIREHDLQGARLENTHLNYTDLMGSNLAGASLRGAGLMYSRLASTNLIDADLSRVQASGSTFEEANLTGANLSGAVLLRANLSKANLSDADLSEAELSRANMTGSNLQRANLRNAHISRANLTKAAMAGSDLGGAYTLHTIFEGVDMSAVQGVAQNQLDIACGDARTKIPPGLSRPSSWPCSKIDG